MSDETETVDEQGGALDVPASGEPAPAVPAPPAPPAKTEVLLEEIRDLLARRA